MYRSCLRLPRGTVPGSRSLTLLVVALAGLAPARADLMQYSYSGTFASTVGVIQAGDAFSGQVTFDSTPGTNACPGNSAYAWCLPLLTDVLNMPAADGLSIPGATVQFAGLPEKTKGVIDFTSGVIQINVLSSVDGNYYSFYLAPGGGGAVNDTTKASDLPRTFSSSGPTVVPEPGSLGLAALVLLLPMALLVRRSRRLPPTA